MKLKALLILALVALMAAAAWAAAPDKANLSSISTTPSSTQNGQGKNYTLDNPVGPGATISLSFTLAIDVQGTSTTYPHTEKFEITTVSPTGANVPVVAISNCALTNNASSCNLSTTITAPSIAGAYQVKFLAYDGISGGGGLTGDLFFINFTVVLPSCTPAPTTLVLATPPCTYYHAGSVNLSATLKSGTTPLVGKSIDFYVDGNKVGSATTDSFGVATLAYNPSTLAVGDHPLTASWTPDDACYQSPAITGATLGIQYLFVGFQPPIDAGGLGLFSGKTIPVKIKITDANNAVVPDATALVYFELGTVSIVGTDPENVPSSLNFDHGNVMRYDSTANQYVYNWDLSTLPIPPGASTANGTYTIQVFLGEGSCAGAHIAVVSVQRKK